MIMRGRLSGVQRMRLGKLLDMLYKPSELAEEIGFSYRQVSRVYILLGCPFVQQNGFIFINGRAFADWYEMTYPRQTLKSDEVFCLTCRKAVKIISYDTKKVGRLSYLVCSCSVCGRKISRIIDKEKR